MKAPTGVKVIIPAFNEEDAIGRVIGDLPEDLIDEVIVVDNGSRDLTAERAKSAGATVIREDRRGYGQACLTGIKSAVESGPEPEILVFLDGDYSDYPGEMEQLIAPIRQGKADMVIGSRALGKRERGSMTPQQVFGNWLATRLIRLFYGHRFSDLGPFRAIRTKALERLGMRDRNYGWTVEMQLKAAKQKLRTTEIPVNYRRRIGTSKVSGTIKGTVLAGYKILYTIFKHL